MSPASRPTRLGLRPAHRTGILLRLHLARIHDRLVQREQARLREFDLTPAQFDVLAQVASHPGLSQQDLAGHLLVTKGNVCGLLDRMEAAGWLERRPDPDDRRAHCLILTERGAGLIGRTAPRMEALFVDLFSRLNPQERKDLARLLGRLDRSLEESMDSQNSGV